MSKERVIVIGGGAAGFFGAVTCASAAPGAEVVILERGPQFLSKVRISGGGRCNVTHACFEALELARNYPRGQKALIAPLHRFQSRDTVKWFETRGVRLKIESDGRMFPITDSSQTIIDCLLREAHSLGVKLELNSRIKEIIHTGELFKVQLENGEILEADRVLLATGGCRTPALGALATGLGHTLSAPAPSLFSFHIEDKWVRELAGISVQEAALSVPCAKLTSSGPLLFTHWGMSGPAILRLSAWGARELHGLSYNFPLVANWLPHLNEEALRAELLGRVKTQGARMLSNSQMPPLPARLWEQLLIVSGIAPETRWAALSRPRLHSLVQQLTRMELRVTGKSLNKDEFVTCGGVRLAEVDFKTMESKLRPGLYFAGELLDIDGITGGFNFQAAWTTGWIAGNAMAQSFCPAQAGHRPAR